MVRNSGQRGFMCDGCRRRTARFALLYVLIGFFGSLGFLWALEEYGHWRGEGNIIKLQDQVLLEQFNLTDSELRFLKLHFSFSEKPHYGHIRRPFKGFERAADLPSLLEMICYGKHDQSKLKDEKTPEHVSGNKEATHSVCHDASSPTAQTSVMSLEEHGYASYLGNSLWSLRELWTRVQNQTLRMAVAIFACLISLKILSLCRMWNIMERLLQNQKHSQHQNAKKVGARRKIILLFLVSIGLVVSVWIFMSMNSFIIARRVETLANMCDERARMLQDQFNVSMNHVHALAILISAFHHEKNPSAIDQKTFAEYTARTAFERPLTSGVAYALKVLHSDREQFEQQHGWRIKKMKINNQAPVQDDYNTEKLSPSPVQDEYAPVIFSQETVSHIVSIDMMSGKEDRDNILRARSTGKGVLTSPFKLLKSNHLGVVLTFAVYNSSLPANATAQERVEYSLGYLGASFDIPSLVEKLMQQLASKQTIVVELYDTTNYSSPIKMYASDVTTSSDLHISNVDFGDPTREHEMRCRFKHDRPLPWSAITTSSGVAVIVLLVGHILYAGLNRIEKVEDDYHKMRELKVRAEAADVAKSQFLATVSHEIRTPMNGVIGMLQMLMDTELDATQQDFVMTARESGKALVNIIDEVLDQAKIESGKFELEAVPFHVRDIMDNVISLFSEKSEAKGIELAVFVSDQVPDVLIGDPGRFRQIITNLVGNSIKFTSEGHIFVSAHLVEELRRSQDLIEQTSDKNAMLTSTPNSLPPDTLSGFPTVDRWRSLEKFEIFKSSAENSEAINLVVMVEDTGVGIPEEAQSRIFTRFVQADSSTKRMYGGTGIGLSISKRLVELMGGEIDFISTPGIGSTFSFTVVFEEGTKNLSDTKRFYSESTPKEFRGMVALIVDGRRIRAEITKYHLQRLGIQAIIATDKSTAVSALAESCRKSATATLDMVLVDKEAWGDGSCLLFPRSIVESNRNLMSLPSRVKFFLLATSLKPSEVEDLKAAGYADSLRKPLRFSMMTACFRKAFGVGNKRQRAAGQSNALRSLLMGKHILVVDDNAINRKVAAGALKKYGATITCVESGKEAIALLSPPHKFDACFMDVQMPEIDGFEATKCVRLAENKVNEAIQSGEVSSELYDGVAHWHVPILAMTADVIQATYEECLQCGMDGYVSKPFEEEQLYSAVAQFLESVETETVQ